MRMRFAGSFFAPEDPALWNHPLHSFFGRLPFWKVPERQKHKSVISEYKNDKRAMTLALLATTFYFIPIHFSELSLGLRKKVAPMQIYDYTEFNGVVFTPIGGWRNGLPHQHGNVKDLGNLQQESIAALQRRPCPRSREKGENLADSKRDKETEGAETNTETGGIR